MTSTWFATRCGRLPGCRSTIRPLAHDIGGCLEERLGRQLTPEDYTDVLINRPDAGAGP